MTKPSDTQLMWASRKRFERERRKKKKIQQLKVEGNWPWPESKTQ